MHQGGEIAVKKLYDMPGLDEENFQNEFKNHTRLSHKNIVRLVGYCHDVQEVTVKHEGNFIVAERINRALCLEYMSNGSLNEYLSGNDDDILFLLVCMLMFHS
jgi:serine/threonine protein kinase